jgi:hypothetical protein
LPFDLDDVGSSRHHDISNLVMRHLAPAEGIEIASVNAAGFDQMPVFAVKGRPAGLTAGAAAGAGIDAGRLGFHIVYYDLPGPIRQTVR